MSYSLNNRQIAVLMTDGVEQSEFTEPYQALSGAGAEITVIAPGGDTVRGWQKNHWGDEFEVNLSLENADPDDYDALLLPGGVMNPDTLRTNDKAVEFVSAFIDDKKPIAAICHGPQLLIETGKIAGFNMTSYSSIKTDLINAGVHWVDQEVIVDQGIVTSRSPGDLPAFCEKMLEEFCEGVHEAREVV